MKRAGVSILLGPFRDILPALACVDRLRIERAVHRGHRVGKRVLLTPHRGVAALDRQGVRREQREQLVALRLSQHQGCLGSSTDCSLIEYTRYPMNLGALE